MGRSQTDHALRNLVVNPAKGQNSKHCSPSIILVSKCGTDMGGSSTQDFPYTLPQCCETISGLRHISHCPSMGKPP